MHLFTWCTRFCTSRYAALAWSVDEVPVLRRFNLRTAFQTQPAGSDMAIEGGSLQLALNSNFAVPAGFGFAFGASVTSGTNNGDIGSMTGSIAASAAAGDHANAFTINIADDTTPVSYTHLTLPTKRIV